MCRMHRAYNLKYNNVESSSLKFVEMSHYQFLPYFSAKISQKDVNKCCSLKDLALMLHFTTTIIKYVLNSLWRCLQSEDAFKKILSSFKYNILSSIMISHAISQTKHPLNSLRVSPMLTIHFHIWNRST